MKRREFITLLKFSFATRAHARWLARGVGEKKWTEAGIRLTTRLLGRTSLVGLATREPRADEVLGTPSADATRRIPHLQNEGARVHFCL